MIRSSYSYHFRQYYHSVEWFAHNSRESAKKKYIEEVQKKIRKWKESKKMKKNFLIFFFEINRMTFDK